MACCSLTWPKQMAWNMGLRSLLRTTWGPALQVYSLKARLQPIGRRAVRVRMHSLSIGGFFFRCDEKMVAFWTSNVATLLVPLPTVFGGSSLNAL